VIGKVRLSFLTPIRRTGASRRVFAGSQTIDHAAAFAARRHVAIRVQRASTDEGLGAFRIFAWLLDQFRTSA
jgi:hypothetical protein